MCIFVESKTKNIVSGYSGLDVIGIGEKYRINDKLYYVEDKIFNIDMNQIEVYVQEIKQGEVS